MKRLTCALCLLTALCSISYGQGTVRIAGEEWPPYSSQHLEHHGLMIRIITEAFAAEGINVELGFFPSPRVLQLVKSGEWDATGGWTPTEERAADYYFSDPLFDEQMVLFHLKSRAFDWQSVDDLIGQEIGTVYGFHYGNAFEQAQREGVLTTQVEHSDLLNFRKLIDGRVDLVPKNLEGGLSLLQTEFTPQEAALITWHPVPLDEGPLVLMFSRANEANADMVEAFNRGLAAIKQDGRYEQFVMESRRGDYLLNDR